MSHTIVNENFSFRGRTSIQFSSDNSIGFEGFQFLYFVEDEEGSGAGPIPDPGQLFLTLEY